METIKTKLFRCEHLGANGNDENDILSFSSKRGPGLEEYLRYYAFTDEASGEMRTYLVRDNKSDELACYFSLKAGLVSLNESEEGFDTVPGIELANFAINDDYVNNHPEAKGVGLTVFRKFVIPLVRHTSTIVGVRVFYIFALPQESLIKRYNRYGFTRLSKPVEDELHKRLKPRYDEKCIFMYQVLK